MSGDKLSPNGAAVYLDNIGESRRSRGGGVGGPTGP